MPGLDGFEVCQRLKSTPETAHIPVIFVTANDDTSSTVRGFQAGAVDYVGKPFREEEVLMRVRTHLENSRLARALERSNRDLAQRNQQLEEEVALRRLLKSQVGELAAREVSGWGLEELVAESRPMRMALEQVRQAQESSAPVLIVGEAGSGRELAARAIHCGGDRAHGPFAQLDAQDIPTDVVASMESRTQALTVLFGNAATATEGQFQLANAGTLFVRHLDVMPLPIQASLVRAIQQGQACRLGDKHAMTVDVRIVATASRDTASLVAAGALHEDLGSCLRQQVSLPALRQRLEDIPELARQHAQRVAAELGQATSQITPEAMALLQDQDYPGNLAELRDVIEAAVVASGGGDVQPGHVTAGRSEAPMMARQAHVGESSVGEGQALVRIQA
jgi:DNA-binding NtrC family response regulator